MEEIFEEYTNEITSLQEETTFENEYPTTTSENKSVISVYVKVNDKNEIVDISSSVFLKDTAGWIKIDEGVGDKFAHAQSQYFEKPIVNSNRTFNYTFADIQKVN